MTGENTRRKNSQETRAQLEAMVLRTKPEANKWLHLSPRVAALGADAFEQEPVMITMIHAYLLKEVNLAKNTEEKTAEFVSRMCQITLETFWTQEMKGHEGFERTDSMLEVWEPDGPRPSWQNLPESLSLLDKGIPPSSSGSVNSGTTSLVRDIRSREFCERTGDTAHRRNSEPAVRWASNTDCDHPRKLGRTNEIDTLSRADERERESEEFGYEENHGLVEQDKRHTLIQNLLQQNRFGTEEDQTIEREEDERRHVGGMPILTDLSLAMRTDPLALIRGAMEFVTVIYGPAVTFAFPDVKMEAYRRSVLHMNLISAVDGSVLNWCEQHVLRELMSEDLLFAKIAEPEETVINFDDHFRDCMGEVERGHIEVFPKLWNLRPYDKTNGEMTRVPRLTAAYHKVREETKDWG